MSVSIHYPNNSKEIQTFISSSDICVIDFYADWCGPCKKLSPYLEKYSKEFSNVEIVKVNVDDLNIDKIILSSVEFSIRSLPTILFFKNGIYKDQIMGYNPDGIYTIIKNLSNE